MRQACQRSLPPAYRRGHTVSRGFGEPQSYLLSVCCDGRGVGRAARRLHCASGSMEATSVQVASVLGTACRKCDRADTTEARRLQSGAVQSTSAISALVASVADPKAFRSGRDFSTWIGLVPKQNSSGGKEKLASITKRGDRYLRSLFTAGALAVIRYAKIHGINHRPWTSDFSQNDRLISEEHDDASGRVIPMDPVVLTEQTVGLLRITRHQVAYLGLAGRWREPHSGTPTNPEHVHFRDRCKRFWPCHRGANKAIGSNPDLK